MGSTLVLLTASLFACSSSTADNEDSTDEAMQTAGKAAAEACGDKFQPAFKRYKKAVDGAKARLVDGPCDTEEEGAGMISVIADHATAAVMICPAFKDVIRTSPFAEPIRKVMSRSLTLRSLTGELLVLRNSQFANWSGVDALIPGTLFETESNGAFGFHEGITFRANGEGTFEKVEPIDQEPFTKTTVTPIRYRIEKLGTEREGRRIFVERNGRTERFDLVVLGPNEEDFETAPHFYLRAEGMEGLHFENTAMSSINGECGD
jgi:hypothetical protein